MPLATLSPLAAAMLLTIAAYADAATPQVYAVYAMLLFFRCHEDMFLPR